MRNSVASLLVPMYLLLLMVVFSGSLHYWIDQNFACIEDSCLDADRPAFSSTPHAMWFVIVTVATVGYGDIVPHTVPGKVLASLQIVMGVCYMAMPITIIGNNFSQVWADRHRLLIQDKFLTSDVHVDMKKLRKIFDVFDPAGKGCLSSDDFVLFIECLQVDISKSAIRDLFIAIDFDRSQQISFDEFREYVFPDQ